MGVERAASWLVVDYVERGVIDWNDAHWAYNRVLESVGAEGPAPVEVPAAEFTLDAALETLAEVAVDNGLFEDTASGRDRAAMRVAGCAMPRPSEVAGEFGRLAVEAGSRVATDWLYQLSVDVNYVRATAIARNLEWRAATDWGELEITINKSKPEKDPRDIAAAGAAPAGEVYPACQLCMENEGYAGRAAASAWGAHPARQNLRVVPITLGGERWGLQFSPYAYFEQHCIAMSAEHRPMHIDRAALHALLDFVDAFPHYLVGSNADLPIVGGSILSHDHFQGGAHVFPMEEAEVAGEFSLAGFPGVTGGVLRWPLTVLRLESASRAELEDAAVAVLEAWHEWSDATVGVVARDADGTPHNTVTPICRRVDGGGAGTVPGTGRRYRLDLALRCNVTSEEHPLGVFHPHADKWHVKKENIGLIEVMGLAILPPRLEGEIESGRLSREEIGRVFAGVLEDAGVFKWDDMGRAALGRFLGSLA